MMTSTMLKPPVPPAGRNLEPNKVSEEPSTSGETAVEADTEERKPEVKADQTDASVDSAAIENAAQEGHSRIDETKP
jgi:hypothetical protein